MHKASCRQVTTLRRGDAHRMIVRSISPIDIPGKGKELSDASMPASRNLKLASLILKTDRELQYMLVVSSFF